MALTSLSIEATLSNKVRFFDCRNSNSSSISCCFLFLFSLHLLLASLFWTLILLYFSSSVRFSTFTSFSSSSSLMVSMKNDVEGEDTETITETLLTSSVCSDGETLHDERGSISWSSTIHWRMSMFSHCSREVCSVSGTIRESSSAAREAGEPSTSVAGKHSPYSDVWKISKDS